MEDKPPARLDRTAVMNRAVGRRARIDIELPKQRAECDSGALVAHADSDGAVFVVDADSDHCPLKPRIGHSGHRQEQLAGEEIRLSDHSETTMRRCRSAGKA